MRQSEYAANLALAQYTTAAIDLSALLTAEEKQAYRVIIDGERRIYETVRHDRKLRFITGE